MLKYTADWILHPKGQLVSGHTLMVEQDGTIVGLFEQLDSQASHLKGILCPGFINAHTHVELSHLSGKIKPAGNLAGFIRQFVPIRSESGPGSGSPSSSACQLMWETGIQGAGDICNTSDASQSKQQSKIRFYSFIETFAPVAEKSRETFMQARQIALDTGTATAGLVPHAPYSVPDELFRLLKKEAEKEHSLYSIHNQESDAENEMFRTGTGELLELFRAMGLSMDWFRHSGMSSLQTISSYFPDQGNILLVHNTYTSSVDIKFLRDAGLLERCWFCLCPKANLFIENRLPDVMMLMREGCRIIVGTDSLASNDSLSVLEELKALKQGHPGIAVSELLYWATAEGADFFGWSDLGRFNAGNQPGVLLIAGADDTRLPPGSTVQRIF